MIVPVGRLAAGQHDQLGLTIPIKSAFLGSGGLGLALHRRVKPIGGKLPANPFDRCNADIQRVGNLLICLTLGCFEQDPSASDLPGRFTPHMGKPPENLPLFFR
jgi:hypothetical protein